MATRTRYISLFSGSGGLDLAVRIALPDAQCVCYVEGEIPVAEILATRMEEGSFKDAPIWSDVRSFDGEPWRGRVDGIVGGFPCQDLSVAGKRAGIDGERSGLWSEFARIVGEVRPGFVFLENVPGLLGNEPMRRVLGDFSAIGYDAEWLSLRASDVGAPHKRERVFILAHSKNQGRLRRRSEDKQDAPPGRRSAHGSGSVPDTIGSGLEERQCQPIDAQQECAAAERVCREFFPPGPGLGGNGVIDDIIKLYERSPEAAWRRYETERVNTLRWIDVLVRWPWLQPAISQAEIKSAVCGCPDGLANIVVRGRTDALRALGNGVVPACAAVALRILLRRAGLMETKAVTNGMDEEAPELKTCTVECPCCGANIDHDPGGVEVGCPFCGEIIIIEEASR